MYICGGQRQQQQKHISIPVLESTSPLQARDGKCHQLPTAPNVLFMSRMEKSATCLRSGATQTVRWCSRTTAHMQMFRQHIYVEWMWWTIPGVCVQWKVLWLKTVVGLQGLQSKPVVEEVYLNEWSGVQKFECSESSGWFFGRIVHLYATQLKQILTTKSKINFKYHDKSW